MIKNYSFFDKVFSGTVFKILYLSLALLSFNAFAYYQPWMKYLVWAVTLFGAANCLYRLVNYKRFIKTPYLILGCLFIGSYLLTVIINIKYGITESVQGLIWMIFQVFLLYCCDIEKPLAALKNEFKRVGLVFVAYITSACVVSLVMLLKNFGEMFVLDKETLIPRGFVWGRLWGVFSDPNYGSASVCISGMLCLFFLHTATKRHQKAAAVLSLIISFLYIVFSDSRTGFVALLCSLFVWLYVRFSVKNKLSEKKAGRSLLFRRVTALTISIFISAGTIGAIYATKEVYNLAISIQQANSPSEGPNMQIKRYSTVEESDPSNRRIEIWGSGLEIFKTSPVAGVGFRNILAAAADKTPDTYIINNTYTDFDAFHNMWMDVLVSQGILGFLLFFTFTVLCALSAFHLLLLLLAKKSADSIWFGTLLAVVVTSLVSSLFVSDTLYVNSPNAVMFWVVLGYLMRFVSDEKTRIKTLRSNKSAETEAFQKQLD